MSDPVVAEASDPAGAGACAQCSKELASYDSVSSGGRLFCQSCYASLRSELEATVAAMSADVNYPQAIIGALLGGIVGVLAWWGFTVLTKVAFGLVAVAIGFLVGFGTVRFAGGKRSAGLQAVSIVVAATSYVAATYLVNMTFINRALAEQGETFRVAFPPQSLDVLYRVVAADFGVMDLVFLAIIVYEAWKIPRPIALPPVASS
jgi:hypothetical protein